MKDWDNLYREKGIVQEKKYSKYFKAFGDKSRLKILSLLAKKAMTVNEIVNEMSISQSTVSRHLAVLREAEVVEDRRDGQQVIYSLNKKAVGNCCSEFCLCLDISKTDQKKA